MACKVQYCRLTPVLGGHLSAGAAAEDMSLPGAARPCLLSSESIVRLILPRCYRTSAVRCGLRRRGAARSLLAREVWAGGRGGGDVPSLDRAPAGREALQDVRVH